MVHTKSRKVPSSHEDETSPSPPKKSKSSCDAAGAAVVSTTKSKIDSKSGDTMKNGNILTMFGKQKSSISKDLDYVRKNAPITIPQGYDDTMGRVEVVRAEMYAASEASKFDLAEEKKVEYESLLTTTDMERKLYHLCLSTKDLSERKIEEHQKKLQFLQCSNYQSLLNIANKYLQQVSSHDVEASREIVLV